MARPSARAAARPWVGRAGRGAQLRSGLLAAVAVVALASGCGTAAGADGAAVAAAGPTPSPSAVLDPVGPACTCGHTPAAAALATGQLGDIDVGGAYVVPSVKADGAWASSAYMSIVNDGSAPARLVGATSAKAKTAQLHGAPGERVVAGRGVDPGAGQGNVDLAPAGYRVLLSGLSAPLRIGDTIPVTLRFAGGRSLHLQLPVTLS